MYKTTFEGPTKQNNEIPYGGDGVGDRGVTRGGPHTLDSSYAPGGRTLIALSIVIKLFPKLLSYELSYCIDSLGTQIRLIKAV